MDRLPWILLYDFRIWSLHFELACVVDNCASVALLYCCVTQYLEETSKHDRLEAAEIGLRGQ